MTLQQLVKLNRKNGGLFFSKETLKSRQERISDFKIISQEKGEIYVERNDGAYWKFSDATGRMIVD